MKSEFSNLQTIAREIRIEVIKMLAEAGSGHTAGSLGMADIFTALYFGGILEKDKEKLVLSNGHICPVLYASLAMAGYFPKEELLTLRKINSRLQGHPKALEIPGVEVTSGPLGQGFSQAVGMALAGDSVYCITSDGEHDEGETWEAIMMAAKYKLFNLTVIVDRNNIQIDGTTDKVMPLEPLKEKYLAFNWNALEIDGHNFEEIFKAVEEAKRIIDRPTVIICKTIPGKGVAFMENDYRWHGKAPNKEESEKAIEELKNG